MPVDLSKLSDDELKKMAAGGKSSAVPDVTKMSDQELMEMAGVIQTGSQRKQIALIKSGLQKWPERKPPEPDNFIVDTGKFIGESAKDFAFKMGEAVDTSLGGVGKSVTSAGFAARDVLSPPPGAEPPSFLDRFSRYQGTAQDLSKQVTARSPVASTLGSVAGYAGTGALGMKALAAQGMGKIAAAGTLGAAAGFGQSEGTIADDPLEVLKDVAIGAGTGAALEKAIPAVGDFFKNLGKKAFKAAFGVSDELTQGYLARPNEINFSKPKADIKDLVDEEMLKFNETLSQAQTGRTQAMENMKEFRDVTKNNLKLQQQELFDNIRSAKTEMTDALGNYKKELANSPFVVDQAEKIAEVITIGKQSLGGLGKAADDILEQSNTIWKKKDLTRLLDKTINAIGTRSSTAAKQQSAPIGDAAISAANKMIAIKKNIIENFGDNINSKQLSDIMRQIRKDIDFDQSAGQFNDDLNRARLAFTESISGRLKLTPGLEEYAKIMGEMSELSEALGHVDDWFGKPDKALRSLQTLSAGKTSPNFNLIQDAIENYSSASGLKVDVQDALELGAKRSAIATPAGRTDFMKSQPGYEQYAKLQGQYKQMQQPGYIPQQIENIVASSKPAEILAQAEQRLAELQPLRQRFQGFTPSSSQNLIERMMRGKDIELARKFQDLGALSGIDFTTMIKDRAIADAFQKGYMNGSRNVNLWSAIGSLFGGTALTGGVETPLTRVMGAAWGGYIDQFGPKSGKALIDVYRAIAGSKFAPIIDQAMKASPQATLKTLQGLANNGEFRSIVEQSSRETPIERRMRSR